MNNQSWLKSNPARKFITDYIKPCNSGKTLKPSSRYIITGGPGVGKTTTLRKIKGSNIEIINEAAADVIESELKKRIKEPWAREGFREKVIALQEKRQKDALTYKTHIVFFDRSPIDTLTYCLHLKARPTEELTHSVQEIIDSKYYSSPVFLIENFGTCEANDIRCEDLKESLQIEKKLEESYSLLGFKVIRIGPGTVDQKIKEILSTISL